MRNKLFIALFFMLFAVDSGAVEKGAIDFSLNNWDGRTVSLRDLKGKVALLTFSYSFCSARCPIVTGRLYSLDILMDAPRDVVYLHISVDPDSDTAERRKKYFSLYRIDASKDNRWMFLSGQKSELSKLWKFYGITTKKIMDKRLPEGYYMDYTPKIVVIDRNGLIRHETGFDFSEDEVAKRIKEI